MTQTFDTTKDTNDLYINASGNLVLLTGQKAVEAACASASKTQLGECVLQTQFGLPNFQVIWVGVPDYAIWQQALLQTLLNVNGVVNVTDIQITPSEGTLKYIATIESQYGNLALSGQV